MSTILQANKREVIGTSAATKIKKQGQIPAIIYSAKENINISLNQKEFEILYYKTTALTTVVEINIDGTKVKAIAHKIDTDPVTDRPIHIDFFNCDSNKDIKAKPRLIFTGKDKSPGLKRGGFLHTVLRRVEIICDNADAVIDEIEIDASKLHLGDKLTSQDVKLPQGTKFSKKGQFLIASVTGRGKSEDDKAATTEEGQEGEAPAADAENKEA